MPHYTLAYNFEGLVLAWARNFSEKHSPATPPFPGHTDCFLAVSKDDFENVTIYWKSAGEDWRKARERLTGTDATYIFYDHFEPQEYCYIEWQNLKQRVLEDLIGRKLTTDDFAKSELSMYLRTPPDEHSPEKGFPDSGGCMGTG